MKEVHLALKICHKEHCRVKINDNMKDNPFRLPIGLLYISNMLLSLALSSPVSLSTLRTFMLKKKKFLL